MSQSSGSSQSFRLTSRERQRVVRLGKGSPLLEYLADGMITLPKMHGGRKGRPYCSHEEFFLKHGRLFRPRPFPSKYQKWRGEMGDCSLNALLLAACYEELHYAEGFAIAAKQTKPSSRLSVGPTLHAWCVDDEGNVVDPTWHGNTEGIVGQEYCGVVFKLLPLTKLHFSGKPYGFAFNDALFIKILTGDVKDWKKCLLEPSVPVSPK